MCALYLLSECLKTVVFLLAARIPFSSDEFDDSMNLKEYVQMGYASHQHPPQLSIFGIVYLPEVQSLRQ